MVYLVLTSASATPKSTPPPSRSLKAHDESFGLFPFVSFRQFRGPSSGLYEAGSTTDCPDVTDSLSHPRRFVIGDAMIITMLKYQCKEAAPIGIEPTNGSILPRSG